MKKITALLLAITLIITGCFSVTEDIEVTESGSGVYAMQMDMSGMFDFIKGMQGEDTSAAVLGSMGKDMDTTIRMSTFTDTSSQLTAEEKALLKDATMHMTMNEDKKQFLMDFRYPYKRLEDVQRIMELSQRSGNMMSKALGQNNENSNESGPNFNTFYTLNYRNGVLEKKIDSALLKQFQDSPQYDQIAQSTAMLGDASMNTIIKLPRKVKKAEGTGIKVSDDGKTVTIAATIADLFDNPAALTYRVEY